MEEQERKKPLVSVAAMWDKDSVSVYPDAVKIPMEDGHVVTYRIEIQQPGFVNAMELLKKMPVYTGYKYRGPQETKKRRRL